MTEQVQVPHDASGQSLTSEQAQNRIKELTADVAFSASYLKGDMAAAAEMRRLHDLAYPEQPVEATTAAQGEEEESEIPEPETIDPKLANFNFGPVPPGLTYDRAADLEIREGLLASELPVPIANELGRRFYRAASAPAMTDQERGLMRSKTESNLRQSWGDDFEANLALAEAEVARVESLRPGIAAALTESGLAHDEWLIRNLFHHAMDRKERGLA